VRYDGAEEYAVYYAPYAVLQQGRNIGTSALVEGTFDTNSRSVTYCNTSVLQQKPFEHILEMFPEFVTRVLEQVASTKRLAQQRKHFKKRF
jgi:hypothetical protein